MLFCEHTHGVFALADQLVELRVGVLTHVVFHFPRPVGHRLRVIGVNIDVEELPHIAEDLALRSDERELRNSPAQIGPDLSTAVEDAQSRFGMTVDAFLANPTGTMSVVLSRQIVLTPEQKQTAVQKLREAFAEYQRQRAAAAAATVRSH